MSHYDSPVVFLQLTMNVDSKLKEYVEQEIIPRYDNFDKAHRRNHVNEVIVQSMQLAQLYDVNVNMVYAIAAFHDTGLCKGREYHHIESAAILRDDKMINELFSADEINIMAEAVEDHRASGASAPRTLYGRIVAEADRVIDGNVILRRTVQYGLSNYPTLSREEHFARACEHLHEKYAEGGYLKLWIPESGNAENLRRLRKIIDDKQLLRTLFDAIFDEETAG